MSLIHITDPNEMITCPYEQSHRLLGCRLVTHLVRCAKNHPNKTAYDRCPFNANHLVPSVSRSSHIAECPDRICVERDSIRADKVKTSIMVPFFENVEHEPSEDWDAEIKENRDESYLEELNRNGRNCNQNSQTFATMARAEKKKQYRYMREEASSGDGSSTASCDTSPSNVDSVLAPALRRMRLPNTNPQSRQPQQVPIDGSLGLGRGLARNGPPPSPAQGANSQASSTRPLGQGRGIGRGRSLMISAPVFKNVSSVGRAAPISSNVGRVGRVPSSAAGTDWNDFLSDEESEWQTVSSKKTKKSGEAKAEPHNVLIDDLEWQLREIRDFQYQEGRGAELNASQLEKIAKKREIERELRRLKK